jgi:replicative DNA helicase
MLAREGQVAMSTLPAKAAAGELADVAERVHSLNCYIDDRPNLSMAAVYSALSQINEPIRLVVFDYLQLAKMDESEKNHAVRVGQVTKGLKGIAKEFKCHVVGLSQLNRGVESRKPPRPELRDLRDSGNIEEDSDNVLALYRPSYYDKSQPKDEAEIIILKQRNGDTGIVEVAWNAQTQTFRDR